MSSFNDRGELDTATGLIILNHGRKKSGKSVNAKLATMSYPGDRFVLDVAGDDGPDGPGVIELGAVRVDDMPRRVEHLRPERGVPMTIRYAPDAGSPTHLEDMDAFVGLAYEHSSKDAPAMILIHEVGVVSPAGQTKPHMRRALMHSRHHALTMIACGPRARTTEPLWRAQADLIYVFDMPNQEDREVIAKEIGWNVAAFAEACDEIHGHEYVRYDANQAPPDKLPDGHDPDEWARMHPDLRLTIWPPLPEDVVRRVELWSHNVPEPRRRAA